MMKGEIPPYLPAFHAHVCLTLIVKELKISVEQARVVITLNIINH